MRDSLRTSAASYHGQIMHLHCRTDMLAGPDPSTINQITQPEFVMGFSSVLGIPKYLKRARRIDGTAQTN